MRKNRGFWIAQFFTEVAHSTRFERATFAFWREVAIGVSQNSGRGYAVLLYHAFDFLHVRDVALGPI
jgi:hypothetical protein